MATQSETLYQFKIHIRGISPMICRRSLTRSVTSIAELHYIVQLLMGWQDTYLNCFKIYGKDYGVYHDGGLMFSDDPMSVLLQDLRLRTNGKFTYQYNFTENWQHVIRLEKILPPDPTMKHSVCLDGKRASPPEDIGGPERYDQFISHLFSRQIKVWAKLGAIISNKQKSRSSDTRKVKGNWSAHLLFDPECFDKREVNEDLVQLYQNKGHSLQSLQESFHQIIWEREYGE